MIFWPLKNDFYAPMPVGLRFRGIFKALKCWRKLEMRSRLGPSRTFNGQLLRSKRRRQAKRVFYIQRPINQSQIRIGDFGLVRHSPDHFAWEVFNELWGGSATSRLFRTVRTQLGLAYSVGSGYSEPAEKGLIVAVSQTRGPQTIAATQAILSITEESKQASFTEKEISDAKESIRNRFVENFTSSAQIAAYVMNLEYFGFPPDYLETYTEHIGQVSADDLHRVGGTYLHPDQSTILVMGDLSTFRETTRDARETARN